MDWRITTWGKAPDRRRKRTSMALTNQILLAGKPTNKQGKQDKLHTTAHKTRPPAAVEGYPILAMTPCRIEHHWTSYSCE